jgi:ABC-type phosphate transport system auxiliary subunit
MEPKYLFVLLFFMIVVGIPVIGGIWADIHKRRLKHEERKMQLVSQETAEKAAQYAAHVERLEQRVRVLERIVTDKGMAVADQIEALRDSPRLDKPLN